ncbi:MAG: hypothetical protein H0Z40_01390 [Desulfotomaculum sp.]|nr:hypothetical protein [Desulfotomaculum sp.]
MGSAAGLPERGDMMIKIPRSGYTYVIDNLVKYMCLEDGKEFIISEHDSKNGVHCPFCQSHNTEAISILEDNDLLDALGCMCISHIEE